MSRWTLGPVAPPPELSTVAVAARGATIVYAGARDVDGGPRRLAVTSDGRALHDDDARPPADDARDVAIGVDGVYLVLSGDACAVLATDLGLAAPRGVPLPRRFVPWSVAVTPAGLWVGGHAAERHATGRVAFGPTAGTVAAVEAELDGHVRRLVSDGDGVLALHGKSVSRVGPSGAQLLKKFSAPALNAAVHGDTVVVVTASGLWTSTDGGGRWTSTHPFARKLSDGERAGITHGHGRWIAKVGAARAWFASELATSTDGRSWEGVPDTAARGIDDLAVTDRGFVAVGAAEGVGDDPALGGVFHVSPPG